MDLVSIIVPVYKVEQYILECLTSLKNQTYQNIEVLVIDDGSPNEEKKIIDAFLSDSRFHYYRKENGGLSSARNFGIKKAKGKYIAFVDGDDYVDISLIEKLYLAIQKENVPISICGFYREYPKKLNLNPITQEDVEVFRYPCAWNKLYLKSILDEHEFLFPEGSWYEDLHFTTRVLLCNKFVVIPDYLIYYRQNPSSIMHTFDNRLFQIYSVIDDIEKFAHDNKEFQNHKSELEFMNINHVLVGTLFRASFHQDFSISMIQEIIHYVDLKYPNWYNNKYVKTEFSFTYRIFLFCIHHGYLKLIYFLLKSFHKFVNL